MKFNFQILFIILLCSNAANSFTQTSDTTIIFNPLIDDITLRIPPLQDLIDSAIIHSPYIKTSEADISIAKYDIKSTRRQWMENFYFDASANRDLYNGLTTNEVINANPNQILTGQTNNRLAAGISIRLPMLSFADLNNQVKNATKKLERAISIKESQILELRKELIIRYNQLIINQRILKSANENITYTSLQKDMGEKEFLNGQTTLYELARISEMHRKAVTDFETSRNEFYNAYMILQEIVGIKFNITTKID
ncbi:MAG: TolC family protein [bacterium]